MSMMIKKKDEDATETSKREQVIKAAETIRNYCKNSGGCIGLCPFNTVNGCAFLKHETPDNWEIPTLAPSREEMKAYVLRYGFVRTYKNGRTTAALYNGNLYVVTRYYKDKDDALVAKYELYKKIFG